MNWFRARIFALAVWGSAVFVALTLSAMWIYPGGSHADASSRGYDFALNFFSDLGRTTTLGGSPNPVSSTLFLLALTLAGGILGAFWLAFAGFFARSHWGWRLAAYFGSFQGLLAGACFVGVALAPANVNGALHGQLVLAAFRSFLLATLFYAPVIAFGGGFPRRMAWVCLAFAATLAVYLVLLVRVYPIDSVAELQLQAVGQKIVVYASLLCVATLAAVARRILETQSSLHFEMQRNKEPAEVHRE